MAKIRTHGASELSSRLVAAHRPRSDRWSRLMLAAAIIILADGLAGERGLLDRWRAQRAEMSAAADVSALHRENDALRESVRLLRDDPATIEAEARKELGLMRPGELLVTIHNLRP